MNGIIPFQIQSLWEMLKIWEKREISLEARKELGEEIPIDSIPINRKPGLWLKLLQGKSLKYMRVMCGIWVFLRVSYLLNLRENLGK